MSVMQMEKLTVIALQSDVTLLLNQLAALSAVEILPASTQDEQGSLLPMLSADRAEAEACALRIEKLLPIFLARNPRRVRNRRTPIAVDTEEFTRSGARERAMKAAAEAERLLAHIEELTAKKNEEQAEMAALLPYLSHPFALDDPGTRATAFLLGSLPPDTATDAIAAAATATGFVFEVLTTDKNGIYIAVIAHRAMQDEVRASLATLGFSPAAWRDHHGRATALFDAAGARAATLDDELARANAQLDSLADNLTDIKILYDMLQTEARLAAYSEKLQALGSCAVLSAWCPAHKRARIAKLLDELQVAYDFTPAAEEEKAPILADTPPVTGRLAPILNAYSYPYALGRSTALPLQILFFLFYGIFFADVGYGILTALLFFPIARFLAVEDNSKHAFYTLACCGLGAIPFGFFAGNYFGDWLATLLDKPTLAPFPVLAARLASLRTFLGRPRAFLALALSLSALLLLLDLTARFIRLCRAGKPLDGILSTLPELFTLAGPGLLIFYPLIGLGVTVLGLTATAIVTTRAKESLPQKLLAYGGALLSYLISLCELLQAARIALIGFAILPVAYLIAKMPLARGEALVWYLGSLLVFLISHFLCILLNRAVAAARRAKLGYMARHSEQYPARAHLFTPMQLPRKYTAALPVYTKDNNTAPPQDSEIATDTEDVTYTTQKL